jgi:squalene-hopene/tetraprenyl-beta-curcumene cyclase
MDPVRLRAALEKATAELLAQRNEGGFWEGELSSSALSTATAVTALAVARRESQISNSQSQIDSGLRWLAEHQNTDGGWGDTTKSLSNISTTTLCWAAFGVAGADAVFSDTVAKAERWLLEKIRLHLPASWSADSRVRVFTDADSRGQGCPRSALARAIIERYGKDRTFSVPILTMCALAGRLGEGREAWRHIIPLPFELAACPHQLFAALRLPVVSYALPALIAIGQARHVHAPSRNPFARLIRMATRAMTLHKLTEIQPSNGGFLEATPLTSFVTMSLAASGKANHIVTQRGLDFLLKSQRPDGSWPIDTNLATWCTTLAIEVLPSSAIGDCQSTIDWLLKQQYRTEHPYTHAAPGGWAWTDLPGGVPDADDTAGALLALSKMGKAERGRPNAEVMQAAEAGIRWLLDLQNSDGGIPTFCRGWGALPFDRSSADITAHTIRAWQAWRNHVPTDLSKRLDAAMPRALAFLSRTQRSEGSWVPLWFGNQHAPDDENPTYGTARVVRALAGTPGAGEMLARGVRFLLSVQNSEGNWGGKLNGPASVEETALAIEALAHAEQRSALQDTGAEAALMRGVDWLRERIESGAWREPSPIGFYFAKLWYFERLYPLIFTVGALRAATEMLDGKEKSGGSKTAA